MRQPFVTGSHVTLPVPRRRSGGHGRRWRRRRRDAAAARPRDVCRPQSRWSVAGLVAGSGPSSRTSGRSASYVIGRVGTGGGDKADKVEVEQPWPGNRRRRGVRGLPTRPGSVTIRCAACMARLPPRLKPISVIIACTNVARLRTRVVAPVIGEEVAARRSVQVDVLRRRSAAAWRKQMSKFEVTVAQLCVSCPEVGQHSRLTG